MSAHVPSVRALDAHGYQGTVSEEPELGGDHKGRAERRDFS